jgi:hypothetical protein
MAITQYKGNFYDTNDPQQNAELLRLQRAENLKKAMQSLQPNRQDAPRKKLEAANLLAQNQALLNARTGVPPVSPNTYNVLSQNNGLLEVAPPNTNINERAARVRSLLDSQQVDNNNTASNQVNSLSNQPAQPQPKKTLGQRAGGLLDRVSDAYMGAAPIFAVAQEFQKAGALRPVGAAMQGDPYGKMMQIQQGRKEAETLANLKQDERYKKFANLPDKQFLEAVNEQIKFDIENKLNVTPEQTIQTSRENAVVSTETEEALGRAKSAFGITDTFREKLGAIGEYVPFRERTFAPKTQAARQAIKMNVTKSKQFFLTDFAGRVAKYTAETINNILPLRFDAGSSQITGFKSESFAKNSYENLKSEVERIVSVAESTLQNPNTTNKEKSDARSALNTGNQLIKEYDIILESLSGEREGTNENAGTEKRLYNVTQFDNQEPIENVRERFYTGGGLQIVAESRGLK